MTGKVVAVTGASSGIGRCIAETLGRRGAHVFLCGRTEAAMRESQATIEAEGGGATVATFDIADEDALRAFIDAAGAHGDGLDAMINNAGAGYTEGGIIGGNPAHWREMLDVNVFSLLVGCQQAVHVMRARGKQGRIINVSSFAAQRRDSGVYGATKHAVNVINATLREELQDDDIRVTSLMPGVFMTNFVRYVEPETINGLGRMLDMDLDFKPGDKLPDAVHDKVQEAMARQIGNVQVLADAVVYILQQPITIGIDEMIVRPQKNLGV